MKTAEKIHNSIEQSMEKLTDYLERLSVRERYMVVFTTIFVPSSYGSPS